MGQGLDIARQSVIEPTVPAQNTSAGATVGAGVAAEPNHGAQAITTISAVGGDANETYDYLIEGRNADADPWEVAAIDDLGEDVLAPGVRATQPGGAQVFTQRLRAFRQYRETQTLAGTTPDVTGGTVIVMQDSTLNIAVAQDPS